jgi:hypothetical protein
MSIKLLSLFFAEIFISEAKSSQQAKISDLRDLGVWL